MVPSFISGGLIPPGVCPQIFNLFLQLICIFVPHPIYVGALGTSYDGILSVVDVAPTLEGHPFLPSAKILCLK